MVGHTWIHSLLIVTGLQFTGAALIRRGDDVSLPCNYLIPDQSQCDATAWIYTGSGSAAVELVGHGEIRENDASKSNRLSLTENCSLVIKQVTDQDAGRYTCRQFKKSGGPQQGGDGPVDLSVVTLTHHEHDDKVTLNCRVWTKSQCRHTVKWLFEDKDLEKTSIKSSESLCGAAVTFSRSSFYSSRSITSFKCEVRGDHNRQNSTFNLQPPNAATAATEFPSSTAAGENPTFNNNGLKDRLWLFIAAAVALVMLLLLVVIGWKRTRGNARKNKDVGASSSAASPSALEPAANMADPEGSGAYASVNFKTSQTKCQADDEEPVSYASINFTKKNKAKAEVCTKPDDNGGDPVTYSTVKAPPADPSSLYASIK